MVFTDPGLSYADLPTHVGDAVQTQCFKTKVILNGLKKTGDLRFSYDVMFW